MKTIAYPLLLLRYWQPLFQPAMPMTASRRWCTTASMLSTAACMVYRRPRFTAKTTMARRWSVTTWTAVPHLAKLDYIGNKTHDVRVDVFSQQVEVAPGVSYSAWTFGGTVPGPKLHVREGDRVVFKMKTAPTRKW